LRKTFANVFFVLYVTMALTLLWTKTSDQRSYTISL